MPQSALKKRRPIWYNLSLFNLPLPGIVSILHRISGAMLFLLIPAILYLLQISLRSPDSFASLMQVLRHPLAKLIFCGVIWAFVQHTLSGIRLLLLDVHLGSDLHTARASARVVVWLSPAISLLMIWAFLL
ncbi:MAG TPA: succinate dehydrogenase, cytochrome b556 subunit [Burkholderiales bacterium]|nr:succinate dehydrogenase, cytochrome b556 subunit [Burkholderiales bacterium]